MILCPKSQLEIRRRCPNWTSLQQKNPRVSNPEGFLTIKIRNLKSWWWKPRLTVTLPLELDRLKIMQPLKCWCLKKASHKSTTPQWWSCLKDQLQSECLTSHSPKIDSKCLGSSCRALPQTWCHPTSGQRCCCIVTSLKSRWIRAAFLRDHCIQ